MESANAPSSPSFPVLDPIIVDDDMENTYRDTDTDFLDPARLSMSSANAGRDFDDLFAHSATSRAATDTESSHLSPSELSAKHQYKDHDKLKQPHMPASDSPAESPDNSSRSSSSESPRNHFRNPSVTSSSSAVHSENNGAPFRFSSEDWMNPELESVKEEPLLGLDNVMPAHGGFTMGTDLESSNKAMDAAFDFESAASSPSYLKSDTTPQVKSKNRVKSKVRSPQNFTRHSTGKHLPTTGLPFFHNGFNDATSAFAASKPPGQASSPSNHWEGHSPSPMLEESFGGINMNGGSPLNPDLSSEFNFAPNHQFGMDFPSPGSQSILKSENSQRHILTVHPTSVKSRVETQIPIRLTLYPLPAGVTKLRLPGHTISKYKFLAPPSTEPSPDTLELRTSLVCTSAMQNEEKLKRAFARARDDPYRASSDSGSRLADGSLEDEKPLDGGEVKICGGCIQRERKRASRKKQRKPEEDELFQKYEEQRVIVFNTNEIKQWNEPSKHAVPGHSDIPGLAVPAGAMQVELPMRIACYCRHQNEKLGFQVIFTVKDHMGNVVSQAITNSIMITDDHKTHTAPAPPAQGPSPALPDGTHLPGVGMFPSGPVDSKGQQPGACPFPQSSTNGALSSQMPRSLSRQASPHEFHGPMSKRRKRSSSGRLPPELVMTRAESQPTGGSHVSGTSSGSQSPTPRGYASPAERPFVTPSAMSSQFTSGPPTPNSNDNNPFFNPTAQHSSLDSIVQQQLMSGPNSSHPSRPGTPGDSTRNSAQDQNLNVTVGSNSAPQMWPLTSAGNRLPSVIHKLVPAEGSIAGGTEVTLLGSGFYPGMEVVFGDTLATTTTFWGDKCLNCLTPPALQPGLVAVVFKHEHPTFGQLQQNPPLIPKQQLFFRYVDDRELQMYRLALGILGHKLGNQADAFQTAQQIMGNDPKALINMQKDIHSGSGGHQRQVPGLDSQGKMSDLDSKMLTYLEFVDLDDSPRPPRYSARCSAGQTLLHFASSMGLTRFVAGLLARGANPDVQDNSGNSPMHLAALSGHAHIVHKLRLAGADPNTRSIRGFTPADLATSLPAHQAALLPSNYRSRSVGSLASSRHRQSSSTSLNSLWETSSGSVSLEHSVDDSDDLDEQNSGAESDSDIQGSGLNYTTSRRSSIQQDVRSPAEQAEPPADARGFSPPAALIAWRNQLAGQINQFQQSVANAFPNLPALPPMPALPDYQAYPMMRRITNLVPHRPAAPRPARDGWWDMLKGNTAQSNSEPPPYEELYPRKGDEDDEASNMKKASLLRAATDTVVDQHFEAQASSSRPSRSEEREEEIQDVKIGRNVISREQQKHLREHQARRMKGLTSDRRLYFIWIPLLLLVICAWIRTYVPGIWEGVSGGYDLVKTRYAQRALDVGT